MNERVKLGELDVSQIGRELDSCSSLAQLKNYLENFAVNVGFKWYSLQDFAASTTEDLQTRRLTNYPSSFWEEYDRCGYSRYDPILKAIERTCRVLCWRDIPKIISLTKKQARVMWEAERAGIKEGVSASVRVPGHHHGLMTLISDQRVEFADHQRAWLSFVAPIAYEVAARFHTAPRSHQLQLEIDISPRQMECLVLVARGKSDWEAGQILGLSDQTVHRHVEAVRQKLGVRRRTQLVVKALHCGLISYRDVL